MIATKMMKTTLAATIMMTALSNRKRRLKTAIMM